MRIVLHMLVSGRWLSEDGWGRLLCGVGMGVWFHRIYIGRKRGYCPGLAMRLVNDILTTRAK